MFTKQCMIWIALFELYFFTDKLNHLNHAWGDLFNPYRAFYNLYTTSVSELTVYLDGLSMHTSSSKSPWRKIFFLLN